MVQSVFAAFDTYTLYTLLITAVYIYTAIY